MLGKATEMAKYQHLARDTVATVVEIISNIHYSPQQNRIRVVDNNTPQYHAQLFSDTHFDSNSQS